MKQFIYFFLIASLIVAVDQITKHLVVVYVKPADAIEIFPFLHIVSVRNTGAAFGILKDVGSSFFIGVSIFAIILVIWLLIRSREGYFSLSLILGGAVGNLIDRIVLGHVVDFIDFSIGKSHWPAFNVADSALTIGIILIFFSPVFHQRERVTKRVH
jgi:signal peptidase II